jgi:N-methylhydantoinase A
MPGMNARLAVDVGGTFTDIVLEAGRRPWTAKVLTTRDAPEDGVLAGLERVLADAGLPPGRLRLVILGTTLATNALIERKGAVTALLTTAGFRDVVEIGQEHRFAQYDIHLDKPEPLVPRFLRLGVPERVGARGEVIEPLDEGAVKGLVPALRREGVRSVAVSYLHGYANPLHERRTRDILRAEAPELRITLASDVCPEVREYERTSTACANAYVQPLMAGYLERLEGRLAALGVRCPVYLMTSSGALTTLAHGIEEPVRLVESGPAGGAILAREVALGARLDRALSFDMGGTTAKICFVDGGAPQESRSFEAARVYRFLKGSGLPIRIPVIEMVEVGAGGGSIARLDELGRVTVGPDSAGADPGPACYQRGGTAPTVTDADVVLGRIGVERFAGGHIALDARRAEAAVAGGVGRGLGADRATAALAISEVVEENMASAARVHAMELGKSVEEYTLIAFGGAAPLHATRLADKLSLRRVIVPDAAGVGSAVGFLRAPVAFHAVRSSYQALDRMDWAATNALLVEMEEHAALVVRAAAPSAPLATERTSFMRYVGQGHEIVVPLPARALTAADGPHLRAAFEATYQRLFGRIIPRLGIEALSWSVVVRTRARAARQLPPAPPRAAPPPSGQRRLIDPLSHAARSVPVWERAALPPGARLPGPAIIVEDQTTTVAPRGWTVRVDARGHLVLERARGGRR